jgi:hypothetical protein
LHKSQKIELFNMKILILLFIFFIVVGYFFIRLIKKFIEITDIFGDDTFINLTDDKKKKKKISK